MEWTKETLLNTCIVMKSVNHAVKIVQFYKSFGFMENVESKDVREHYKRNDVGIYIGIDSTEDTKKCHGWWPHMLPKYVKEIKLPSKPRRKFPREMMVSDGKKYWATRVVLAKCSSLNYPYIAASPPYKPEDEFQIGMRNWKYAKEID